MDRLSEQIEFIHEIDKLKQVLRRSYISDGSRRENDTEHSWHIAVMTMLLCEYAEPPVDSVKVIKMLLIHDIVEVYAGDVIVYSTEERAQARIMELAAADRIFSMLPQDQASEFRSLWDEFEARTTPEARFARVMDRLQPILLNYWTHGRTWRENGITAEQVMNVNLPILMDGSPALAEFLRHLLDDAKDRGYFADPSAG